MNKEVCPSIQRYIEWCLENNLKPSHAESLEKYQKEGV